jgi:hypothetical protein
MYHIELPWFEVIRASHANSDCVDPESVTAVALLAFYNCHLNELRARVIT